MGEDGSIGRERKGRRGPSNTKDAIGSVHITASTPGLENYTSGLPSLFFSSNFGLYSE